MLWSLFVRRAALCFCWGLFLGLPAAVFGQTNYYRTNGTEYAVIGSLPGDQVFPDVALTTNGGFVVWQDNITDGDGWGVSARRLDSTLSGTLSTFRVNVQGTNDQKNPRVALLKKGGAVFVWQGGPPVNQHIYARLMSPTNTFLTTIDELVSSFTNNFQVNPAVTVLNDGNAVVVWASFDQAGANSLLDVYGQIISQTGQKVGTNFLINQFTAYNQRTPAIAALKTGGFVVAWVSEQERSSTPNWGSNTVYYGASGAPLPSVDIYARLYASNGVALGNEFLVNEDSNPAANPAVAAASDGSFMITWDAHDMANLTNSWDIYARSFTNVSGGAVVRVNTHVYGDQYLPRISAIGGDYLVVWTSLGQDGSREGVFGQFLHEDGSFVGGEFQVNTTTLGSQMQPVVASDGVEQFLVAWTSFTFSTNSMDLFAQRYINVAAILEAMDAPYVYAPFVVSNGVYQPQLQVSWSALAQQGISVSNYEVYVDGAGTPAALTASNFWMMTAANGLTASSPHSFQLDYVTTDGRRSPISPSANGTTWSGTYWGTPPMVVPFEWMEQYFGNTISAWPSATADSDGDGMNNYQEFLAGTNPTNAASVLSLQIGWASAVSKIAQSPQGMYVSWVTQPGLTYQVQTTTNFTSWSNLDAPRFAAGTSDSIFVGGSPACYYRVVLLR